jgi:glycosyltransferase involved in cell wall biosynthesis
MKALKNGNQGSGNADKMKILYVLHHDYEVMPIHSVEVIEEMHRQGHQVDVLTAISPRFLRDSDWQGRIQVYQVPIFNFRVARMLSFFLNSLVLLPYWCLRKSPEIIYERFSLTSLGTLWVTRALRIPLVVEVNGIVSDELRFGQASRWRLFLQEWVERRVFWGCNRIITVTEGIRQWIGSHYSVPLEKIDTISNGVNPRRFRPIDKAVACKELGMDSERPIVGFLGSLFPWWELEVLVEASPKVAAQVPNVLFLIGGSGQKELKADLERKVQDLGMGENFLFWGQVPWDRAALFTGAFDIAVAPYRLSNPRSGISPLKLYSYLACERPVVGSNTEGLGNVLAEEGVGLTFRAGDAEELAKAILRLLKDKDMAKTMGRKGREVVLEQYTWEGVVKKTAEIFSDLLNSQDKRYPKPVPPEVYTRKYYLMDMVASAEFTKSRGLELCAQHAQALELSGIKEGDRVLDVGCGCGELTFHSAIQGARAIGIDYAASAVDLAKEALRDFSPEIQERVQFIVASAEDCEMIEAESEGFDRVFLMDVIEHLHPWQIERVYRRLYRALKPGGKIICHTWPNRWHTVYLYPIVYYIFRLFGIHKPKEPRLEHDKVMHVNEQSAWSVWRDFRQAGFKTRIWMEHDSSVDSHPVWRYIYRFFHGVLPFSLFFADHIWCIATKK